MTTVYISGPMTGLPDLNAPAFDAKQAELEAAGYDVINPARAGELHWTWLQFMKRALVDLSQADAIYMLTGWETSKGAVLERAIALALEYPATYEDIERIYGPKVTS